MNTKVRSFLDTTSGVLFFVAFLPYMWAILNRETIPSPITWTIWASIDTLALIAMRKEKAKIGQLTGAISGAWIITILAFIFGQPTIGFIEWFSIVGATVGIILWKKTANAVFAIIFSQVAVFIGSIPTFVNAYVNPSQEDPIAWTIWFVSCIFALFAVRKWNLSNALQPITFTVVESIMVFLVVVLPHLL